MNTELTAKAPENIWAPVSIMVAGLAMVLAFIPWLGAYFAWLPGLVAIALAIVGMTTARRLGGLRQVMSVVGLVIAIVAIAWSFTGWILLAVILSFAEGG
jgi:hypothetical protein